MTFENAAQAYTLLDEIHTSCGKIGGALADHLGKTSNQSYMADIEKDIVTLENLKRIAVAVKQDIESGMVGASTELLLRIAANDFKNKLNMIPEKKSVSKGVMRALEEVHRMILRYTIHGNP